MELNREQTKQALECCTHTPRPDCNNCPMGEKRGCINGLLEFALKHYKKLDAAAESYKSHCKTLENDNETLRDLLDKNFDTLNEEKRKGYEQGVKDFAERVKRYYHNLPGMTMPRVTEYAIDLMAKEMIDNKGEILNEESYGVPL